jgi:hypothetical protein
MVQIMKLLLMHFHHHTVTPYFSGPHILRCTLLSDNLSLIIFDLNRTHIAEVTTHYVAKDWNYEVREEMDPEIASSRFLNIRPTFSFNKTSLLSH